MRQLYLSAEDSPSVNSLARWDPSAWTVAPDWQTLVDRFLKSDLGLRLGAFVQSRLAAGATVYPPDPFRALALTPLAGLRVVILGQDPYHGPGQANGLAFSVADQVRLPPSLRNIFKEIARHQETDSPISSAQIPTLNGSLEGWARQGVLLINTCLTVEQGQPASHSKQGWEALTDAIIQAAWSNSRPTVFMLWGAHAQSKLALMTPEIGKNHLVLMANHPSPLSALRPPRPFLGCGHFVQANAFLRLHSEEVVKW